MANTEQRTLFTLAFVSSTFTTDTSLAFQACNELNSIDPQQVDYVVLIEPLVQPCVML